MLTVRKKGSTCSHIIVHDTHFCSLFYCSHIWQSYYSSTIEISKSYHIMSYHYLFTIFSNSQARQQPSKALIACWSFSYITFFTCLFVHLLCFRAITQVWYTAIGTRTTHTSTLIYLNSRMIDTKFFACEIDVRYGIIVRRRTMNAERNLSMTDTPNMEILQ